MKYLNKFNESNNGDIESFCRRNKITNYTINDDQTIDVDGSVRLIDCRYKIPFKFNRVTGEFNCSDLELDNLENSPNYVGGNFYSRINNFYTLRGCPEIVEGDFTVSQNSISSLRFMPKQINGSAHLANNNISQVEGFNSQIHGGIYVINNPINQIVHIFAKRWTDDAKTFMEYNNDYKFLRGRNIIKSRFEEALLDFSELIDKKVTAPFSINGYKYI